MVSAKDMSLLCLEGWPVLTHSTMQTACGVQATEVTAGEQHNLAVLRCKQAAARFAAQVWPCPWAGPRPLSSATPRRNSDIWCLTPAGQDVHGPC